MSFADTFRDIVETVLERSLTAEDGLQASDLEQAEDRLQVSLPSALRQYYSVLGGLRQLNTVHNRLLPPAELALGGDWLVFMDENQSVCQWALRRTDLTTANPAVYQGQPQSAQWLGEKLSTAEFLSLHIYLQAVWGGLPWVGDHLRADQILPCLRDSWDRVVDHQGLRIWQKEGMLISNLEDDEVCIGAAATDEKFRHLEKSLGFQRQ